MRVKGPIFLLICALLWGFAFVAQTTGSQNVGPFTFNASRNAIGFLFLTALVAWRKRVGIDVAPTPTREWNRKRAIAGGTIAAGSAKAGPRPGVAAPVTNPANPAKPTPAGYSRRTLLIAGVSCGVVVCAAAFLQQSGIGSYPAGTAASGRSGFITATYMVMVAVMALFMGRRLHPAVLVSVGVALVGMYLLCVPNGLGSIYLGDWLVLGSAFGYALHIIIIDRYTQVDGVRLSRMQMATSAIISCVGALVFEHPTLAAIGAAIVPILYAGICSDGIAYTLQIVGQQTTDATVASVIMSLESVFAALGGWVILSERLSGIELLGCALVFAAVLLAQAPQIAASLQQRRTGR